MFPALLARLSTVEILLILPSRHYGRGAHPLLLGAASGARGWVSHGGGLALDDCRLIFLVRGQFLDRLWGHG
jgi:hypothetical protein